MFAVNVAVASEPLLVDREVRLDTRLLGKGYTTLLGSAASEQKLEALRPRLHSYRVLHLATNGTVDLTYAERSRIILARDRLHEAWLGFVQELTDKGPMVVLVEDLHWAEHELFELLELLLRAVEGPLLLVATTRPELLDRRPGWGGASFRKLAHDPTRRTSCKSSILDSVTRCHTSLHRWRLFQRLRCWRPFGQPP